MEIKNTNMPGRQEISQATLLQEGKLQRNLIPKMVFAGGQMQLNTSESHATDRY
jgi:hypothetical protein